MFPSVKSRFATAARRGFDLAIEFATLGEYGLTPADEPAAVSISERSASRRGTPGVDAAAAAATPLRARRLRPATAAARRLQPPASAARAANSSPPRRSPVAANGSPPRRLPATPDVHHAYATPVPRRIATPSGVRELAFDATELTAPRGPRKRAGAARPRPQPCLVADALRRA
jgi:hypothetical protein